MPDRGILEQAYEQLRGQETRSIAKMQSRYGIPEFGFIGFRECIEGGSVLAPEFSACCLGCQIARRRAIESGREWLALLILKVRN